MLNQLNFGIEKIKNKDRIRSIIVENVFSTSEDWVDAAVVSSSKVQWCEWNHSLSFDLPEQVLDVGSNSIKPCSISTMLVRRNVQYHAVLVDMLNLTKKLKYPICNWIVEGYKLAWVRKSVWGKLLATDGMLNMFFLFKSLPKSIKRYYYKKKNLLAGGKRFKRRFKFPKYLELGPWVISMPIRFKKLRRKRKRNLKSLRFRPKAVCIRRYVRRRRIGINRRLRKLKYWKIVNRFNKFNKRLKIGNF